MELVMNEEEVTKILLEWAANNIAPDKFNTVSFRAGYNSLSGVTLEWEELEPKVAA